MRDWPRVSDNNILSDNSMSCFQVFQDPTAMMQQLLNSTRPVAIGAYKHETDCKYNVQVFL